MRKNKIPKLNVNEFPCKIYFEFEKLPKPLTQKAVAGSFATNTVSLDARAFSIDVCLSKPNLSVIWIDCTNNMSSRLGAFVSRV